MTIIHKILLTGVSAVMALTFVSCGKDVKLTADAVEDRATMPVLDSRKVTTLISDSGVVRYRITTDSWQIYDKATPAYWEFPEGVYLEKFNPQDLSVDAYLQADYAHYNRDDEIWHLVGNVKAKNLEGEEFETPELWWSQKEERVWSDQAMSIHRATSIINGVGFDSNQDMTRYTIRRPTGIIPIDE